MKLNVLIMAAGLGTRMKSKKAKVLHKLAGQPLVNHVFKTASSLLPAKVVVVVGYQAEIVQEVLCQFHQKLSATTAPILDFATQSEQLGTGHAVMMAREHFAKDVGSLIVLSGDVPLVSVDCLKQLVQLHEQANAAATVLTTHLNNPTGYGRIVRNSEGYFEQIVEDRDATSLQREIKEINSGIYCFNLSLLFDALSKLSPVNAQGEYYLTDTLSILRKEGHKIAVIMSADSEDVLGINTRSELASLEKRLRKRKVDRLMASGVTFLDPDSAFIDDEVVIGCDTVIYPQVIIEGATLIGEGCTIGMGVHISSSSLGDGVTVRNHSIVVDSQLANRASVGPFAHLRMNTHIAENATIGNFVEIKNSSIGKGTKAMHLSYVGDATIGNKVNIGAGTVTCNYDGKQKHRTVIEDNVKIGSDTMLVAPVKVGQGSMTGAGSVVTKDVAENSLVVGVPAVVKKKLDE
ncbi:MAG: bifunctional UDP-N-acetylglucosamine diphosphorylase/glucosamine-1-phosphate N-acetyltransferase GlmU [Blastocatellia bacterium]|nr:bifunctional UDP-N-acetylglucosamine diphosphorylase/glucosamine-1-phosphate N-acetyltransferase GlmU [Blastocatellia bacterium]